MENANKVSTVLKKIPFDIIILFLFSFAITIFSFYLNLDWNKKLKASLIPYTGWGFGRGYLLFLFFIPLSLLSLRGTVAKTLIALRIFIIIFMLMELYDGVTDWFAVTPKDYTNPNPYLRYDALTPIYTIATPLFWILLMSGTLLWNYFSNKNQKGHSQKL